MSRHYAIENDLRKLTCKQCSRQLNHNSPFVVEFVVKPGMSVLTDLQTQKTRNRPANRFVMFHEDCMDAFKKRKEKQFLDQLHPAANNLSSSSSSSLDLLTLHSKLREFHNFYDHDEDNEHHKLATLPHYHPTMQQTDEIIPSVRITLPFSRMSETFATMHTIPDAPIYEFTKWTEKQLGQFLKRFVMVDLFVKSKAEANTPGMNTGGVEEQTMLRRQREQMSIGTFRAFVENNKEIKIKGKADWKCTPDTFTSVYMHTLPEKHPLMLQNAGALFGVRFVIYQGMTPAAETALFNTFQRRHSDPLQNGLMHSDLDVHGLLNTHTSSSTTDFAKDMRAYITAMNADIGNIIDGIKSTYHTTTDQQQMSLLWSAEPLQTVFSYVVNNRNTDTNTLTMHLNTQTTTNSTDYYIAKPNSDTNAATTHDVTWLQSSDSTGTSIAIPCEIRRDEQLLEVITTGTSSTTAMRVERSRITLVKTLQ